MEMFNDEVMMAKAIFKATYIEDGNENSDEEVVTSANKLSLIGTKWGKKLTSAEGGKETLVELKAKLLWRGYYDQAEVAIALLKKEDKNKLLRIFGKKGELQEWAQKKGINLTYNKLEIFHGDTEMVDEGEGTPAEAMQLTLGELKKRDALGKQSIIAGKLSGYLQERYPEKHQQIHAHVMSISTRALVGMLFIPRFIGGGNRTNC